MKYIFDETIELFHREFKCYIIFLYAQFCLYRFVYINKWVIHAAIRTPLTNMNSTSGQASTNLTTLSSNSRQNQHKTSPLYKPMGPAMLCQLLNSRDLLSNSKVLLIRDINLLNLFINLIPLF